jgi:DNA sulfur modification protein DndD
MIIKKIILENFQCYYDINEFDLKLGLNIILGDNGEGKTKFFEAIFWLFNGNDKNLEALVSAKKIKESYSGGQFRVRVLISAEQYGENITITKYFLVTKESDSEISTRNYSVEGIEENKDGERDQVDGYMLLDRIFPYEIRRYSMFKGEAELNIFENVDALSNLINSFSSAKYYEKYAKKGEYLRTEAEKAVDKDSRNNQKNQREYNRLEAEIKYQLEQKNKIQIFIDSSEQHLRKIERHLQEAEKFVDNAEAFDTVKGRIKKIEEEISITERRVVENYTTNLFDESWILLNFENIHNEFAGKIENLSSTKRELQKEFDKQAGIAEGKRKLKEQLKDYIPLPVGVPSKVYMEEMIKDNFCKVCGRDLDEKSLKFMEERLTQYLESQNPNLKEETQKKVLFENDYLSRLINLSIIHEDNLGSLKSKKKEISDFFDFIAKRKQELKEMDEKLEKEQNDLNRIIGTSSLGADKLSNVLKNYNGWQKDSKNINRELNENKVKLLKIEQILKNLNDEKDKIDINSANNFLINTRRILRDIEIVFKDTKEKKYNEFIDQLQKKSNIIFQKINIDDFTGEIVFIKKKMSEQFYVDIELHEDNKLFSSPNQSLETSMHMAILFAISELASENRDDENYPMIFDAPTSSFGETKTKDFLNLVYETGKQRIILFYDFIVKDKDGNQAIKPEFNDVKRHQAFWIKRERPFDKNKLSTINTNVIRL